MGRGRGEGGGGFVLFVCLRLREDFYINGAGFPGRRAGCYEMCVCSLSSTSVMSLPPRIYYLTPESSPPTPRGVAALYFLALFCYPPPLFFSPPLSLLARTTRGYLRVYFTHCLKNKDTSEGGPVWFFSRQISYRIKLDRVSV